VFYCDLQKAFDCVTYDILPSKMEFYGITGKANNLIEFHLQDRFQRVLTDYHSTQYTSDWVPVKHGVPQGSILGPLFFLLYNNNLPKTISDICTSSYSEFNVISKRSLLFGYKTLQHRLKRQIWLYTDPQRQDIGVTARRKQEAMVRKRADK
jgi:hypothetical protein